MKKRLFIFLLFFGAIVGVSYYITSAGDKNFIQSVPQTPASAPRSLTFDKISPFPLEQNPIVFTPSFSSPVYPSSLPEYSTASFDFPNLAKKIAGSFSFKTEPVVFPDSPGLFRWNTEDFYILFMESPGIFEYGLVSSSPSAQFVNKFAAEQSLIRFLTEKKLLPDGFSAAPLEFFPITVAEGVFYNTSSASEANAMLIQGGLMYNNAPFVSSTFPFSLVSAIVDSTGVRKLSLFLPPDLVVVNEQLSLNSSVISPALQNNSGKVVFVLSELSVQETETVIPISRVSIQSVVAGFVWDKTEKRAEPTFIASGRERKNNALVYYLIPNTQ